MLSVASGRAYACYTCSETQACGSKVHTGDVLAEGLVSHSPICPALGFFLSCFMELAPSHRWFGTALGSFPKPLHALIPQTRVAAFYNLDSNRMPFAPSELHQLARILTLHSSRCPASLSDCLRSCVRMSARPREAKIASLSYVSNLGL